jgi:hypothetical protein
MAKPPLRLLDSAGNQLSMWFQNTGAGQNIVDTRDVAEAMKKLSQYEQEKRLARARQGIDVRASCAEPILRVGSPALPDKVE